MTARKTYLHDDKAVGPLPRRGTLIIMAAVLLAGAIAGHRQIPNVRGLGSLIDTLAPFFAVGIPLLAVAALVRRSRRALASVLIPAVVWAALYGTAWLPGGGGLAQLTVVSQNLRADNPTPAATVAALAATGADLVALQEIATGSHEPVVAELERTYPHRTVVNTVALWSRYPIRAQAEVDIGMDWTRALRAVVDAPQGDVAVYVVHLGSARPGNTGIRDRTVERLAAVLRQDDAERLIVLGDFNTATTDRVITPLTDLLRDAQADAGQGPGFTWPATLPITRPDHIFYRGLTAASADVVRTPASDHRAVIAGFRP
ncbi:MAG TPA: endonuclease/exonuclease/phosphatase family protein [Micromonosporaceae bacterium]|nr:endonuclease/exonuclease/phosphatase family protein [Micromonosporaceae bacterium]